MFAVGAARDRLKDALLAVANHEAPNIPPLPEEFQHYRSELGVEVYGSMGIARGDKAARMVAVLRNFEFFGAPLVGIVCMHQDLGKADALSVGMYLQTLLLALTARGAGYVRGGLAGGVSRRRLNPAEYRAGTSDHMWPGRRLSRPDFPTNKLNIGREAVEKSVVFLDH